MAEKKVSIFVKSHQHYEGAEPEDMESEDYEAWAERHEALADQEDDILDDLDRLKGRG